MIAIALDPTDFIADLDVVSRRQLPYATALALNKVAFAFQESEQVGLEGRFTLRRSLWVKQGVYFPREQRADYRTGQMSATVSIEPKRDFLTKFEGGGWKAPRRAFGHLAVPIDARRNKADIVAKGERIGALQLRIHGRGPKGTVGRGLQRTFSIRKNDGTGYIFRRVGRGKRSTVRLLYLLRPRTPVPASLEFFQTAEDVARARFAPAFAESFEQAMRTAR